MNASFGLGTDLPVVGVGTSRPQRVRCSIMKRLQLNTYVSGMLMLWAMVLITGCSKPEPTDPAKRYIGSWRVDVRASLSADPDIQNLPASSRKSVSVVVSSFLDKLTIQFTEDGKFVVSNGQDATAIPYTVQAIEAQQILDIRLSDPSLLKDDPRQALRLEYQPEGMRLIRGTQVFILQRR